LRDRAWRRYQRRKAWNKAYNMIRHIWRYDDGGFPWDNTKLAYHIYKNRQACSCTMCGHFRDLMGPPISDLRQSQFSPDEWFECIGCRAIGDCNLCPVPSERYHEMCEDIDEDYEYWTPQ
jgi:hypothetical protein